MIALIFTVLFGARAVVGTQEACRSGKFTSSGECCIQCQPGEGVLKECGPNQTVCTPCPDSEMFSASWSHTERCQKCTRCTGLMRMDTPCTDSNDATCVCDYNYYGHALGGCAPCTVCAAGAGVLMRCTPQQDTVCEPCVGDLYSGDDSALDPCLPCTICEDDEVQLQACTRTTDTVCQDLNTPNITEFYTSSAGPTTGTPTPPYDPTPSAEGTPESATTTPFIFHSLSDSNLIPVYCSILAAGAAGLLAFIIFKRWNSCKQNKQGAGIRTGTANPSQTPSPEGEKLHSDSGISVDSQSLQEQLQQGTHTVVKIDGGSCMSLPLHSCEEVEKLLIQGGEGHDMTQETDWCNLAGLLGYEEERIATFSKEERPIHALLTDWASQDSASVDALCTALRKINRDDIVQSLGVKPTATSAV